MSSRTPDPPARIAVVSTQRSGNTWVRGMLSRVFELEERAAHSPDEVDWDALPPRCVLQIHWRRVEPFVGRLDRHGFRVAVLARHPLDVLISALNYTQYSHPRDGCTKGPADCMACAILGQTPRSAAFLDYACGWPAETILGYTRDWWPAPGVARARFEDLVADPHAALGRLVAAIGLEPRRPIAEAVRDYDMHRRRGFHDVWHYHFGQGRPGLWRSLLPADVARRIAAANRGAFDELGYACDPDEALTDHQADRNWFELQLATMRRHLDDEQAKHRATQGRLVEIERALGETTWRLGIADRERDEARRRLDETLVRLETTHHRLTEAWERVAAVDRERLATCDRLAAAVRDLEQARARLAVTEGLGPAAVRVARRVERLARHPALSWAFRALSWAFRRLTRATSPPSRPHFGGAGRRVPKGE
jgi:hypothetical protein